MATKQQQELHYTGEETTQVIHWHYAVMSSMTETDYSLNGTHPFWPLPDKPNLHANTHKVGTTINQHLPQSYPNQHTTKWRQLNKSYTKQKNYPIILLDSNNIYQLVTSNKARSEEERTKGKSVLSIISSRKTPTPNNMPTKKGSLRRNRSLDEERSRVGRRCRCTEGSKDTNLGLRKRENFRMEAAKNLGERGEIDLVRKQQEENKRGNPWVWISW